MVKVIVAGCAGRMGQRILTLVAKNKHIALGGAFERTGHPCVGKSIRELCTDIRNDIVIASDLKKIIDQGDVVIDFSAPEATVANVECVRLAGKKIVIGTTGLKGEQETIIKNAAKQIAVVYAPNMSVGVNLLFKLTHLVASTLGTEYDVEIVEAHHRFKKDAPSGTAKALAREIAAGRRIDAAKNTLCGREGMCGERTPGAIGIHAVRGGDVVGEHTVSFMTEGERLELTHRASSRDAFAQGALVAAQFVHTKKKGLFTMQDVLGLT